MDSNSTGRDGLMTPGVSNFSKELVVRMGFILPPGFLLPVKEQVVVPNDPKRVSCFPV